MYYTLYIVLYTTILSYIVFFSDHDHTLLQGYMRLYPTLELYKRIPYYRAIYGYTWLYSYVRVYLIIGLDKAMHYYTLVSKAIKGYG